MSDGDHAIMDRIDCIDCRNAVVRRSATGARQGGAGSDQGGDQGGAGSAQGGAGRAQGGGDGGDGSAPGAAQGSAGSAQGDVHVGVRAMTPTGGRSETRVELRC